MTPTLSMKHYQLDITLLDDLVFSLRPATQGDHECLDRVPGTALWGWAAAWLHRHHPDHAQALAHEGRLQFSDARPLSASGAPTWPMPLVWAADKGSNRPSAIDGQLQAAALLNLSHPEADAKQFAQAKGLRGGYVSAAGEQQQPKTRYRLKTAINAETGTVASGQLFGYDSLQSGQRFQGQLRVAADADASVVQALLTALAKQARLGRSRSGEYGRVRVQVQPVAAPAVPALDGERLVLWLLSDALLRDAHGRPSLTPDPAVLGLYGARFVPELSALRHRSYSPWNAHRNTYGVERQVLVCGSVMVFERPGQPFTAEELAALQAGVGSEQSQGLGEVHINPALLRDKQPVFAVLPAAVAAPAAARAFSPAPDTVLIKFLQRQTGQTGAMGQGQAEALAKTWIRAVCQHLVSARRYAGIPTAQPLGPNPTQWGRLASALEACQNTKDLADKVFAKVLGLAPVAEARAGASSQGRAGVHQTLRLNEDWNVCATGAAQDSLGALLQKHFTEQFKAAGDDWRSPAQRAALRAAVHACNEIRRSDLHLNESLKKLAPTPA